MEPEKCENCGSIEPMQFFQAVIDGKDSEGWNCDNCGHFHIKTA